MRSLIRMGSATVAWALASTCLGQRTELPVTIPNEPAWMEEVAAAGLVQVRFVNSIADMGSMEVVTGDRLAFGATAFGGGTGYAEVVAGSARFQLRSADGRVIAECAEPLRQHGTYLLVASRNATGEPTLTVNPERSVTILPPIEHRRT